MLGYFINPGIWPATSHDLNPVDYCIWGLMQEHYVPNVSPGCGRVAAAAG